MPQLKEIEVAKQLLFEGRDAERFFEALIKAAGLPGIQVQNFGGVDELHGFLKALVRTAAFRTRVSSLAIIRDAEDNPAAAFQSVCGVLRNVGLPVPSQPRIVETFTPRIGVLILPDETTPGMLETVCLQAIAEWPIMECVEEYFHCIQMRVGATPKNLDKAKVHAYLSSMVRPHLTFGQSAEAGYWPFENPIFDPLKEFLIAL
jgi:hypothetical protein